MTTDGEVIEYVRDINVLLKLDTFQGMSDAEIQSVIDFKVEEAKNQATTEAHMDEISESVRVKTAARAQAVQDSTSMLESLLRTSVPYVNVTGEEVN